MPLNELDDLGAQPLLAGADVHIAQRKHVLKLRAAHTKCPQKRCTKTSAAQVEDTTHCGK
jgi:hypothetical protein